MSTKEYGCFFCEGKSEDYDGQCNKCSKEINIGYYLLNHKIYEYEPIETIGRGFYGWTLKCKDPYQVFAIKIIPIHRLKKQYIEDREQRALSACSPHRNIAKFVRQVNSFIVIGGEKVDLLCLVFEFIENAIPLRKLIEAEGLIISRSDVVDILIGICSGLNRLHSHQLWHDDLHDDNVLIRKIEEDENLPEKFEAKLIDFGSVKPINTQESTHGDYHYLSKHIFLLVASFEYKNKDILMPTDRNFAWKMRTLGRNVSDKDISRRNCTPEDIIGKIRNIARDSSTGNDYPTFAEMLSSTTSLVEPLSNTNALTLEPQDISILFRDSLDWSSKISKSENTVMVVGPRGCGKTMLLRYYSIASQARPRNNEKTNEDVKRRLDQETKIGFLVSSGQITTPFYRSSFNNLEKYDLNLTQDFCREYINSHFAFEVARSILWLKNEDLLTISEEDIRLISSTLGAFLDHEKRIFDLENVAEVIDKRVTLLSNILDYENYKPSKLCSVDFLFFLAKIIKSTSFGMRKEIWFLLDDYSVTLLPITLQKAYNSVLFKVSPVYRIKLSSEGDGPITEDSKGRKFQEGREFSRVNLGEIYFSYKEEICKKFFEQILDARFQATGKGSLTTFKILLGENPREKKFGEYLISLDKPGSATFYGFGLLCKLCSGDVSFILELFNSIVSGHWDENKMISIRTQDEITKKFSHRLMSNLNGTSNYGSNLYNFADKLGQKLKTYLFSRKTKSGPNQTIRIQVEGLENLPPNSLDIHNALLRHSILIVGGYGKSPTGVPVTKFFYRRLFAPCFPLSPDRSGCLSIKVSMYQRWLLNPEDIMAIPLGEDDNYETYLFEVE